ncbi:unnamed protein product [Brachionus calyciflorus]|uniref:Uncharacterized protein n=1 Tax=Brachionus calyciflorus TaxID=104777 RepID=A0A813QTL9_9BILA|nr:unnamed protein product [Brachionus calyciflorus]
MKRIKILYVIWTLTVYLKFSLSNPVLEEESYFSPETLVQTVDPNSFVCYDEYDCNNCGIVIATVNGNTCQLCICGEQYKRIMTEVYPFTSTTTRKIVIRTIKPKTTILNEETTSTTETTTTSTTTTTEINPFTFECYEEYDCEGCGIVFIRNSNGKQCQVCRCGKQYEIYMNKVRPFLTTSTKTIITRTPKTTSNPSLYECYDELECGCPSFISVLNGKKCKLCMCGPQIEFVIKEVLPFINVPTRVWMNKPTTKLSTWILDPSNFECYEEYDCQGNCGIAQITTVKNSCQVCICGAQYKYYTLNVLPYLVKTTKKIVTREKVTLPQKQSLKCFNETNCGACGSLNLTINGERCEVCQCGYQIVELIKQLEEIKTTTAPAQPSEAFYCYDEPNCSCGTFTTILNGKRCQICKCGEQIGFIIEQMVPKMKF